VQNKEESQAPKEETKLTKKEQSKKRRQEKKELREKEKRDKKRKNKEAKDVKRKKKPKAGEKDKKPEPQVEEKKDEVKAESKAEEKSGEKEGEKEVDNPVQPVAPETKKQVATRHLGNVTKESQITFEFGIDKDFKSTTELKELPFQVQIRFTTLDGTKCIRSITRNQPVTKDRDLAEKDADLDVLGVNIAQQAAKMAFKGEYSQARLNAYANKKLMKRTKKNDEDEGVYVSMKANLNKMEKKLQSAQLREKKGGRDLSDSEGEDEKKDAKTAMKQKMNARAGNRSDGTATYLYQMKNKKKSK